MKNLIIPLVIVFCFSLVSSMYAGETYTYNTNIKNLTWNVTGNTSNLEGLNISHSNNQIILDFAVNFKPDNFTITFYDNNVEVVTYSSHHSSGRFIKRNVTNNNVTNNTYIPIVDNEIDIKEINNPEQIFDEKESNSLFWIIIIGGIGLIIGIILFLTRKKEDFTKFEDLNNDERRENE